MSLLRIIPVLFIKNGLIVRSQGFKKHQILGNVVSQAKRLNDWSNGNAPIVDTEAVENDSTRDSSESVQPDYEKIFNQLEANLKKNLSSFLDESDD